MRRLFTTRAGSLPCSQNIVLNPYTGEVASKHPFISRSEVLAKLDALAKAQQEWAALALSLRIERVQSGAKYFSEHADEIARDVTASVGKPLAQSKLEVRAGIGKMLKLCEQAPAALAVEASVDGDFRYEVQRAAKGVVEIIAPWNYPIFTALNGVVPALLSGNAVALKHQSTPAVGDHYERAFGEMAGAPLTHLCVDVSTSDWIAEHADTIAHRVFTGSVRGGRAIAAALGKRAANVELRRPFIGSSLELGGCDAAYIHCDLHGDALRHATEFILTIGRLHNAGQSCCATKRAIVHPEAYSTFVELATAVMARQVWGDPLDRKTTIGPLYGGSTACDALFEAVLDARCHGARVVVGGEEVTALPAEALRVRCVRQERSGHFFVPTLLLDATAQMRCMREEQFGPLLAVARAPSAGDSLAETIALATNVGYGLTGSVWTLDAAVADAFVAGMSTGTCFVNWANDVHAQVVWSGLGLSGNGAGAMGHEGFRVLTNPKSVVRRDAPMKLLP